jgi:hypothetical protein
LCTAPSWPIPDGGAAEGRGGVQESHSFREYAAKPTLLKSERFAKT